MSSVSGYFSSKYPDPAGGGSLIFFAPNLLGHPDNYIEANPLSTPAHIVPEWYFLPFYAILKSFTANFILDAKLWGVLAMFGSILLLFFLPWLDRAKVKSIRYRGWLFKAFLSAFAISFVALGYLGMQPATTAFTNAARVFALVYFAFFALMPWYTRIDATKPVPERVTYDAH